MNVIEDSRDLLKDLNCIDIRTVSKIQSDLDCYDIRSLVFLLYDEPHIARERLSLLHRLGNEDANKLDLLHDWALTKTGTTWRYELLEALSICQLNNVISNLGLDVNRIKNHFLPNNVYVNNYINPMKKILYKLCENMCSEHLNKFKKCLSTFDIQTAEYEFGEHILLHLMCEKFIEVQHWKKNVNVDKLVQIVERLPNMNKFALDISELSSRLNKEKLSSNSEVIEKKETSTSQLEEEIPDINLDCFELLINQIDKVTSPVKLKSDTSKYQGHVYDIKNTSKLGICYIINQEIFHPSKHSMTIGQREVLEDRVGSNKDKQIIESVFKDYNFKIIIDENLPHNDVISNLKKVIKEEVSDQDSVFVLCLMSHGIKDHIYGADSVPIKISMIQDILDETPKLFGRPKVLIIQACQASDRLNTFKADGRQEIHMSRKDFLTYYATVPDYLSYRHPEKGTIFIQILCRYMKSHADDDLGDICTNVNRLVTDICTHIKYVQVPVYICSLTKKLYFRLNA